MKKFMILWLSALLVGFTFVGCKEEAPTEMETAQLVKYTCPGCGEDSEPDAYCVQCNAVATTGDTVPCDKCDKDYKEGEYCADCNRFMFDDPYFCAEENRTFTKGSYCPKEGAYRGLTAVKYCPQCKKPFDGALEACPDCK